MPAFQWDDGILNHYFSSDVHSADHLVYVLLKNLPSNLCYSQRMWMTLRMFSPRENRWLDIDTLLIVRQTWPYFDPTILIKIRLEWFVQIEGHNHGWQMMNPCAEILLGEPILTANMTPEEILQSEG